MRILIWNSHGEVDVLCAETADHLECICRDVLAIVKEWYLPEFSVLQRTVDAIVSERRMKGDDKTRLALVQFVRELVSDHCSGDDSFERFYFDRVKYPVTT